MVRPTPRILQTLALLAVLAACGGAGGPGARVGPGPQADLVIRGYSYIPADLVVAPGTTIHIRNEDPVPHSVTSQTAPAQYTPGAVYGIQFDTGPFTGETTIYIPARALPGTVIPYYCGTHRGEMANDGQITVEPEQ